jgi:hypothetical protein
MSCSQNVKFQNVKFQVGVVPCAYNPSYLGGIVVQGQTKKKLVKPHVNK